MHPRDFFNQVAEPNVQQLYRDSGNLSLAVNALLTLDAFFGIMHAYLVKAGDPQACSEGDVAYRDRIAASHRSYQILRDAAFSLKHGTLTGKKARLVKSADQVGGGTPVLGEMVLDEDALEGEVVFIEVEGSYRERAEHIAMQVADVARALLSQHGL